MFDLISALQIHSVPGTDKANLILRLELPPRYAMYSLKRLYKEHIHAQ